MNGFQQVLDNIKRISVKETIDSYRVDPIPDDVKFILYLAELAADRLSLSDVPIDEALKNFKIGMIRYRREQLAHGYADTDSVKVGEHNGK